MTKHHQAPGNRMHPSLLKYGEQERKVPQDTPVPEAIQAPVTQRILSMALLNGGRELVIEHAGEEYRLRLTSKGKLILTK